jgi:hypothetical protein
MKLVNESHGPNQSPRAWAEEIQRIKCDFHTKCECPSTRIPGGNTSYEGC